MPIDLSSYAIDIGTAPNAEDGDPARTCFDLINQMRQDIEDYFNDLPNIVNEYTAQQYFGEATLTDGANISWNLNTQQTAHVVLGGNRTLDNPTNMQAGATYILRVEQDSTGSRTLAYGSAYKFPGGTAPTLTTAGGSVDILSFYSDGTSMFGVATLDLQ